MWFSINVCVNTAVLSWAFSPADGKKKPNFTLFLSARLENEMSGVYMQSSHSSGWGFKGILGMIPLGGWVCWTGWLKPIRYGCCLQSVKRRPTICYSNSDQRWGLTIWACLNDEYSKRLYNIIQSINLQSISWLVIPLIRCSWCGNQLLCRERFCLYMLRMFSQKLPSATSLSERTNTVSVHIFGCGVGLRYFKTVSEIL